MTTTKAAVVEVSGARVAIAFGALVAGLVSACSPSDIPKAQMPLVNSENCQTEVILKIKDKATREEFAGLCARQPRGPDTLPSNPKKWGIDGERK